MKHASTVANLPDEIHVVRHQYKRPVGAFGKQLFFAAILKPYVPNHDNFVDQVAVEFDGDRERESQSSSHSRGVCLDRFQHLLAKFGEIIDEGSRGRVIKPVDPADKPKIIPVHSSYPGTRR